MDMVYKYVMLGAPSVNILGRLMCTSREQFFKSWYVFFFQMPLLPELALAVDDFKLFKRTMCGEEYNNNITEEDIDAYKYTFSKPGLLNRYNLKT